MFMSKIEKRLQAIEERLKKLEESSARAYYFRKYNEMYNNAFKQAKIEICNKYKPKFSFFSNITEWKNTRRCASHIDVFSVPQWYYNDIIFNEEDCKILESLYKNVPDRE